MTSTNTPHTPPPDGPEGGQRANISARCSADLRVRVDRAAAECGMSTSAWLKEVAEAAVEMHEAGESEPAEREGESAEEFSERWEDYERRVNEDAAAARQALEAERAPRSEQARKRYRFDNPRDCPHLPTKRAPSGRCGDCGGLIKIPGVGTGARIASSIGSPIGPGRF